MNKTISETVDYLTTLKSSPLLSELSVFVMPPFTALAAATSVIGDALIRLGAQNAHWADAGAFTGEVSPLMLKDSGVEIVELGHSDRRALFGETDCSVNAKVKAALRHGLKPLVCVGDSTEEFTAGASVEAVLRQVKLAFAGVGTDELAQCLVAYEPIWAIGEGGRAADPSYVANVHGNLRSYFWNLGAFHTSVLYGGSVNVENASNFAAIDSVDGLFVGRAAETASGFERIMAAALRGIANRNSGHHKASSGSERSIPKG